jgi:hypothetical protein
MTVQLTADAGFRAVRRRRRAGPGRRCCRACRRRRCSTRWQTVDAGSESNGSDESDQRRMGPAKAGCRRHRVGQGGGFGDAKEPLLDVGGSGAAGGGGGGSSAATREEAAAGGSSKPEAAAAQTTRR